MQSKHGTLVANTVTAITALGTQREDSEQIEVTSRDGSAEIYFTTDGTDPTVGGDNTEVLPAGMGSVVLVVGTTAKPTIKLISAGTPKYSVRVSWPDQ